MAEVQQSTLRNRLLQLLPPEDFALLPLQRVPLPARLVLVEPSVPIEHLYFMEDGMTSITSDMSSAKIELGMIGREGLVAAAPVMLDADRSPYLHFVQMPGAGLRIARKDLLAAVDRSPVLRSLLLRSIQALLVQTAETAYANAVYTIEVRLARWLLMCHDRIEGNEMALTHDLLAQMLGVRRPGVSVATQMLEGEGLIRARRRRITILDRAGLEALAGEAYGSAESHYTALMEGGFSRAPS